MRVLLRGTGRCATLVLALLVGVAADAAAAQRLDLPDRKPDAPTGTQLVEQWRDLSLDQREARVLETVLGGNVPTWLRPLKPIEIPGPRGGTITVFVTPDYLAVGSDDDYLLMPMTPATAQRIADAAGAALPTPLLVDAIWASAAVRLTPSPIPPDSTMTTLRVFAAHDATIKTQMRVAGAIAGALVAGHKKDVVISREVGSSPGHVAIYGWHEPDGSPIQPLYLGHTDDWVDYSHGVRLVHREILVDGEPMDLWNALVDPVLAPALSSEGVIEVVRYRQESG